MPEGRRGPIQENQEWAAQLQMRFLLLAIALSFGTLSIAVQTAKFYHVSPVQQIAELCSWAVLLTCGLAGLYNLKWRAASYDKTAEVQRIRASIRWLETQDSDTLVEGQDGTEGPAEQALEWYRTEARPDEVAALQIAKECATRSIRWVQILLVAGLLLLAIARAYEPLFR